MNEILELMAERKKKLLKLKKKMERSLVKAPEGTLHISHGKRGTQYYHRNYEKGNNGIYIRKDNRALASQLAQKDYNEKILHATCKELKAIEHFCKLYPEIDIESVYDHLHEKRKCLITPIEETDEEYVEKWVSYDYAGKDYYDNLTELFTIRGERVRSKSELIIANLLYQEGIPYRYEAPIYLEGLGTIHPDFTVLNIRKRKEYYLEHLGMMDDAEYADAALNRIYIYEQNGIFPGEQLLITHETQIRPLNPKQVMMLIERYLK